MNAIHSSELGVAAWVGERLTVGAGIEGQVDTLAVIPGTALLFGLMLAAAILGGYLAHLVRVPRVVGYLIAGIVLKAALHGLLQTDPLEQTGVLLAEAARPLKAITDIGLGVILFSIGGVFEARHFRPIGGRLLRIALGESGLTLLLVFAGTAAVGLILADGAATGTVLAFALLLGFASIATAPAATLFVVREYDAKGPVTDAILGLTGLNNIFCVVMFYLCFALLAASGLLGGVGLSSGTIWIDLVTMTVGSVVLGVALGFALSILHAMLRHQDTLLILVAVLIVTGAGAGWLLEHHSVSYNFLLSTLCMGATFANVAIDPGSLDTRLQDMSRPILVGFFVIAGYKLHLGDLADLQFFGIAYIVCRLAGKTIGAWLGMRWSRARDELPPLLGTALLCQAAVVIGLAEFVSASWQSEWAQRFVTVVLGSVVVFEVCGPILTKGVVKRAGEVKAVTLLRRTSVAEIGGASIVALSWHALMRTVGRGRGMDRGSASSGTPSLLARHVMRANVKCIPAGADFDEVLRFVEQSRFNHFPVVDEQTRLVGIIHFHDIQGIIYDPHLVSLMTASDIAGPPGELVHADMPLTEVLAVFQQSNLGSMPVVESAGARRVIGILERRDVLRAAHLSRDEPA
ncbi:MAG: cation:proton antiporter [Planctomycetes bacterium]|nr:cation:proton antiporter [Planctomycetota bacterium]